MPKKQDEKIYDAEFTETSAEKESEDSADSTKNSLVIADTLSPLDPTQDTDSSSGLNTASFLVIIAAIALLILAALYLRGLQLATI